MVLLDTSGSMEYSAESDLPETLPTCHLSRQTGFSYEKSRWAVAVEVLTGSFNDYWCQLHERPNDDLDEDSWWLKDHGIPRGTEVEGQEQRLDGFMDVYRDSAKFGLMTFDSNPLYMTDVTGGFSYGEDHFFFNLGARNDGANFGAMVVPDPSEDLGTIRATNEEVQTQVLATRPYWATPTASQLDDALFLFENDDRVKDYDDVTGEGDPYSDCRTRVVVLITDGEPTTGFWSMFYPSPYEAALALYEAGIKVYVVGLQADPDALAVLDGMALAGGTDGVYVADDQAQLTASLGEILVELRGNRPARARGVFTNRTLNFTEKLYGLFGSFSGAPSPLDEQGQLDQYVFSCEEECKPDDWEAGDGAALCEIFSIDDRLNSRSEPRMIYTQLDGLLEEVTGENTEITPDHLGVPDSGPLARLDPLDLGNGQKIYSGITLGNAEDPGVRAEYFSQLLSFIRADSTSRRGDARLGAIVHSDPVVQADLYSMTIPVTSFNVYRALEGVIDRPTVLFVGSHEGMLHAFRVDRMEGEMTEEGKGEELWGFIPKHLLEKAHDLAGTMQYLLDGDPVIQEVRLYKNESEIEEPPSLEEEAERWRSIVLSGYGEGGRGYFALDVTKPEEFRFMWEISDTEICYQPEEGSSSCNSSSSYELMGYTASAAAIGTVFTTWAGPSQERAVAIVGGGGGVEGVPDSGKAIYVVDLVTGELIREFCNDTSECGDSIIDDSTVTGNVHGFDCPVDGDVAAYNDSPGTTLTRAFVGDSCGQLWRLDVTNQDPGQWTVEMFYDAFEELNLDDDGLDLRRPIKLRPALAIGYQRGELVLLAGSGNPDTPAGSTPDRVFSITERWNPAEGGYDSEVNWLQELEDGEIFTGEPIVFDQVAYFTTVAAPESGLCAIGAGRIWGVHYTGYEASPVIDDVEPMLDVNDDPLIETLALYQEYEGAELYGLQIVQRAACTDSVFNYAPWLGDTEDGASIPGGGVPSPDGSGEGASFGGSSGGAIELTVQTSDMGASDSSMQTPAGGGISGTGTKKIKSMKTPAQSVYSMSWGLLFD